MKEVNGKYVLEFDEPPALVFVQRKANGHCEVYQDGERLKGIRSIVIRSQFDEPTTHEVEYATGATR